MKKYKDFSKLFDLKNYNKDYNKENMFDENIINSKIEIAPTLPIIEFDINGEPIHHIKNPKIKKKGVVLPYTNEHLTEILKASEKQEYFLNNYFWIRTNDYGIVPMTTRPYQLQAAKMFEENRFSILNCSRQSGKSTIFSGFVIWYCIFNELKNVLILANKYKTAKKLLKEIKRSYESIPLWMQMGVDKWNENLIVFENGTEINISATSEDGVRGDSANILVIDECISGETKLTIKNKNGVVEEITIENLFEKLN